MIRLLQLRFSWVFLLGMLACSGTDTGNPILGGGTIDETETTLAGTLRDSAGNPVANCSLWVRPSPSPLLALAKITQNSTEASPSTALVTGIDGAFSIRGLAPGHYALVARQLEQGIGLLQRIQLHKGDSLRIPTATLSPLRTLRIILQPQQLGQVLRIPELGLELTAHQNPLLIPHTPLGTYTLQDSAASLVAPLSTEGSIPADSRDSSSLNWGSTSPFGTLTDLRDGAKYPVRSFATHLWTLQNLHYPSPESTCHPQDTTTHCTQYGRFYSYMQALNACPVGWSLPTEEHWVELFAVVSGSSSLAASMLKSAQLWKPVGLDAWSFAALPVGSAQDPSLGANAFFWVLSPEKPGWSVHLQASSTEPSIEHQTTTQGYSVRCVKAVPRVESDH